jgi:branched-chain amino acid transport system ATP-binding protein
MGIGRTYQIPLPYGGMTTFENLLGLGKLRRPQEREGGLRPLRGSVLEDCEVAAARQQDGGLAHAA